MKRFLTLDEWNAWAAAGKPPMSKRQRVLAIRSVSLAAGKSPGWGRKVLARRGREAGAMLLAGATVEETRIMADAEPELRAMWLAQMGHADPAPTTPLGMDEDRYQLHQQAKQLAQTRCDSNPRLDLGETYALAAVEIAERQNPGVI